MVEKRITSRTDCRVIKNGLSDTLDPRALVDRIIFAKERVIQLAAILQAAAAAVVNDFFYVGRVVVNF